MCGREWKGMVKKERKKKGKIIIVSRAMEMEKKYISIKYDKCLNEKKNKEFMEE